MTTVFFDLDGTLTDPRVGIVRSIHYALETLGLEVPPDDDFTWCIGPPLLESLRRIVGDELAPQALKLYRERFADLGWCENELYTGVVEALQLLTQTDSRIYVATSKPQLFADRIIKHFKLDEYFLRVFGSELDGTRSDKRDLLKFALTEVGPVDTAVMVGDREHDIIGARANGMASIGVTYGYGSRRELTSAGASRIVDAPAQLVPALA
ncbi:MAG: HAD-IA family hydrolase [Pseudomonadota bacterium]